APSCYLLPVRRSVLASRRVERPVDLLPVPFFPTRRSSDLIGTASGEVPPVDRDARGGGQPRGRHQVRAHGRSGRNSGRGAHGHAGAPRGRLRDPLDWTVPATNEGPLAGHALLPARGVPAAEGGRVGTGLPPCGVRSLGA